MAARGPERYLAQSHGNRRSEGTIMAASPLPNARTVEIDTPEQVVLGFELADLGSRFLALVLDGLLLATSIVAIVASAFWLQGRVGLPAFLEGIGVAGLTLLLFGMVWGYFVYFEAFREGRTPGKKWVGLRVVHDGGHPLTLRGAAIRNLLRVIDAQPGLTWLAGGLSMMLHPQTKRLGDLAAGTLVVRDRGDGSLPDQAALTLAIAGPPRLTDAEFEALDRFLGRQGTLEKAARERLVLALADALASRLPPALNGDTTVAERLAELHAEESLRRGGDARSWGGSRQAAELMRRQRARWEEYRSLLDRAQRSGLAALPEADLPRFAALYRLVAADLARARTYGGSGALVYTLERWVGAGHNLLYRPALRSWSALRDWLIAGFPRLVRARRHAVGLATAALFLPAIVSYTMVRLNPALARDLLPPALIERAELAPERLAAGQGYTEVPEVFMPAFASRLIANNVQVTFLAFAGGILFGVGTLLLLAFNGVFLGAVAAIYDVNGAGVLLWTFVAAHGVVELAAACIAGAAGLRMGSALLLPGRNTRIDALTERAREAVSLLAGTTMMLIIAGLIEGFISPAPIPATVKLSFAAVIALLCLAYLLGAGRRAPAAPPAAGVTAPAYISMGR
jgi:uncharacterized membrane protein SpoIIM required for sporulation/uncharacterized RDD family membrane protein YckC